MKKFFSILAILFLISVSYAQAADYKMTGVVVLSRHNIRSPLVDKNSALAKPHNRFKWTSAPAELSLRGAEDETIMGQYFRRWLVSENLITENYFPKDGEVRFYANSRQRTIATAKFFSSGLFPVANVQVEHKFDSFDKIDPVFKPRLTLVNDKFIALADAQIKEKFADKIPTQSYRLIEKVTQKHFPAANLDVTFELGKEPAAHGTLKLANQAADALTLQYYEEDFGHKISFNDRQKIADAVTFYAQVLFTAPAVATNIAHPLLQVINDELSLDRKFTFLCGHDSNIASVLAALDVEDYSLPQTLERKTPIGVKFVIEKWRGADGVDYAKTKLIYASSEQLRNKTTLTLENPPMIYPIKFKGLSQNADGFYRLEDLQKRFQKAFDAYNDLPAGN